MRALLLALFCLGRASASPSRAEPLSRAKAALDGLTTYFYQTERGGAPAPPAVGCPCFTCDGRNCSKDQCAFCGPRSECDGWGCFTTEPQGCNCNDPSPVPSGANTAATYFFACGQAGGSAAPRVPVTPAQCKCVSDWPSACENCYRWWSAVSLEAMVNYAIAAALPPESAGYQQTLRTAESVFSHAPYNAEWNATAHPTWVDDFAWYGLAYMRVHEWTGDDVWRRRAAALQDWGWRYGWDTRPRSDGGGECGGFFWSLHPEQGGYKDSITMVELTHLAARLAAAAGTPADESRRYLERARAAWSWIFAFDGGLLTGGVMSTGAQPAWCCHPASGAEGGNGTCANSGVAGMSYNHGILLSTAGLLYNLTGEGAFLSRATSLLAAAAANLTNGEGAIRDVQRGSRSQRVPCNASDGHDPGSDFFSFKGIFASHAAYFARFVRDELTEGMRSQLVSLLEASSEHAWSRSAVWPPFPKEDSCDVAGGAAGGAEGGGEGGGKDGGEGGGEGGGDAAPHVRGVSAVAAGPPKFRWWWSSDQGAIETPPDPRHWLAKADLNCAYAEALWRWNGTTPTQQACEARCGASSACTKYAWGAQSRQCRLLAAYDGPDRGSVGCTHAKGWTVGAKRPPNAAAGASSSCGGRCGDAEAEAEAEGAREGGAARACMCDAACSLHLDCCLDYATACLDVERRTPSCEDRCWGAHGGASAGVAPGAPQGAQAAAVPIPGGGYCYCDEGCVNKFTDNNSEGSCCADYQWRCAGGERDQLCMDARTQAQALHLFVAHSALLAPS